jgi:hypothetical protein
VCVRQWGLGSERDTQKSCLLCHNITHRIGCVSNPQNLRCLPSRWGFHPLLAGSPALQSRHQVTQTPWDPSVAGHQPPQARAPAAAAAAAAAATGKGAEAARMVGHVGHKRSLCLAAAAVAGLSPTPTPKNVQEAQYCRGNRLGRTPFSDAPPPPPPHSSSSGPHPHPRHPKPKSPPTP